MRSTIRLRVRSRLLRSGGIRIHDVILWADLLYLINSFFLVIDRFSLGNNYFVLLGSIHKALITFETHEDLAKNGSIAIDVLLGDLAFE